jgi:hypothetical protein
LNHRTKIAELTQEQALELSDSKADTYSDEVSSADELSAVSWTSTDIKLTPLNQIKEQRLQKFQNLRENLVTGTNEIETPVSVEITVTTPEDEVIVLSAPNTPTTPFVVEDDVTQFTDDIEFTKDEENEELDTELEGFLYNMQSLESKKKHSVESLDNQATNILHETKYDTIAKQLNEIGTPSVMAISPYGKVCNTSCNTKPKW